jgi:aryl-alcohol dehydrogenase-like predicted oxidoreductase
MAWVIKNKDVSSAITGASHENQLTDIVGAVAVYPKITSAVE